MSACGPGAGEGGEVEGVEVKRDSLEILSPDGLIDTSKYRWNNQRRRNFPPIMLN